ncbi:MAG: DNA polymerase III subunit delta [Bacteroidetes bacterium]|nr:DNA polymerase III subunit delta [Bacteroidota bacterium]
MLFSEIVGNTAAKRRLIQTVRESRVSHAQLFLGPEGSGKLQLALAYAQFINCKSRTETDSCGVCPSCAKYNKLIHPDLHFVFPTAKSGDAKPLSKNFMKQWREYILANDCHASFNDWISFIGVERKQAIINAEDCTEIIKTLSYKQYESEYKVMIIWMTEKLFHSAAPKLLKILEEPPEKTLFLLIAEDQDQILNTILSRAQLFKISKLTDDELAVALKQKFTVDTTMLQRTINLSNGNFVAAQHTLNQIDDERQYFDLFTNWMRACYTNNIVKVNEFMSEFSKMSRESQKSFLSYGLNVLRECFIYNLSRVSQPRLDEQEQTFVSKFAAFVTSANIEFFNKTVNDAISHVERNANANILFVDVSLTMHKIIKMAVAPQVGIKK